jgi:hypothetical protein
LREERAGAIRELVEVVDVPEKPGANARSADVALRIAAKEQYGGVPGSLIDEQI